MRKIPLPLIEHLLILYFGGGHPQRALHTLTCKSALQRGTPGIIARLVLFLKCAAEDAIHSSLRVGGCVNDEPVILLQLCNPVLDVCGGVAVGILGSNASDGTKKGREQKVGECEGEEEASV